MKSSVPCKSCGWAKRGQKQCTVCAARYCDATCQKTDWKRHKKICFPRHEQRVKGYVDSEGANCDTVRITNERFDGPFLSECPVASRLRCLLCCSLFNNAGDMEWEHSRLIRRPRKQQPRTPCQIRDCPEPASHTKIFYNRCQKCDIKSALPCQVSWLERSACRARQIASFYTFLLCVPSWLPRDIRKLLWKSYLYHDCNDARLIDEVYRPDKTGHTFFGHSDMMIEAE